MFQKFAVVIFIVCLAGISAAYAQEDATLIEPAKVPASGATARDFAPRGWMVEQQVKADLNGDGIPDLAIKLVEVKPAGADPDNPPQRSRALVVALAGRNGKFDRAAVGPKVLQCTRCGGALYGVMESPANLKIFNGVIIVDQDHGSRDVTDSTLRIRYDAVSKRFILIGLDVTDRDRAAGGSTSESSNFLTGVKLTRTASAKGRVTTKRSTVSTDKRYLEDVDQEALGSIE